VNLPDQDHFPDETVLLFDQVLLKNTKIKKWIDRFKFRIHLKSGEKLKSLAEYSRVLKIVSEMAIPKSTKLTFVSLGGGSVGDFSGFLASTYLRGRRLIHIPSTWLSAMDSAHGGKTALNLNGIKNQIGTFHPAHEVWICQNLLISQPPERLRECFGEAVKMALLGDSKLFNEFEKQKLKTNLVWKHLPKIIDLKYKIITKDPHEINGERRLLNLGHTLGHVYESLLGWPHGISVLMGIRFSAHWSFHTGLLPKKDWIRICQVISNFDFDDKFISQARNVSASSAKKHLMRDKKIIGHDEIDFIFISKIGNAIRKKVKFSDLLDELERQRKE
jgi:3-dehydroquinate synthetase